MQVTTLSSDNMVHAWQDEMEAGLEEPADEKVYKWICWHATYQKWPISPRKLLDLKQALGPFKAEGFPTALAAAQALDQCVPQGCGVCDAVLNARVLTCVLEAVLAS